VENIQAPTKTEVAKELFLKHGGILRTGEALDLGIHRRTLYAMRDSGLLERLDRGLYRLADLPPLSDPDIVTVARKIPDGVICLISALNFYDMTSQIPHAVSIAVRRGKEPPRLNYPPTKIYNFSGQAYTEGIEEHVIDETPVRVYSAEKTIADCFKYRHKLGMDTVRECLEFYRKNRKTDRRKLLQFARICRVEKVMRPYLEVFL
jgi:predicted transcriptional regulator of viral defense system